MKLPGVQYEREVQTYGRYDVEGPLRVANARAAAAQYAGAGMRSMAKAFGQIAGQLKAQQEEQDKHDAQIAFLGAREELAMRQANRYEGGVATYGSLPSDVQTLVPNETIAAPDGSMVTRKPELVPYSQVAVPSYDSDVTAVGNASMANLSPGAAARFQKAWQLHIARGRVSTAEAAMEAAKEEAHARVETAIDRLFTNAARANEGDPEATQHNMTVAYQEAKALVDNNVRMGIYTPREGRQQLNTLAGRAQIAPIQEAIADGDVPRMQAMFQTIADPNYVGPLTNDQRVDLAKELNSALNLHMSRYLKDTEIQRARLAGDLHVAIQNGRANKVDLDMALERRIITAKQYISLRKKLNGARKSALDWNQKVAAIFGQLKEGIGIRPEQEGTVDKLYEQQRQAAAKKRQEGGKREEQFSELDFGLVMSLEGGYVPKGLRNDMETLGRSRNPRALEAVARVQAQLDQAGIGYASKLPAPIESRIEGINKRLNMGYTFDEAVTATDRYQGLNDEEKREVSARMTAQEKDNPAIEDLRDRFGKDTAFDWMQFYQTTGNFSGIVPSKTMAEWRTAYRDAYLSNGEDAAGAQEIAYKRLLRTTGTSQIDRGGKPKLMRYPPERLFNIGAGAEARVTGENFAIRHGLDPDRLVIETDAGTEVDPKRYGYAVLERTEDGLGDRLIPGLRFLPTPENRAADARAAAIIKAQEERKVEIEARQAEIELQQQQLERDEAMRERSRAKGTREEYAQEREERREQRLQEIEETRERRAEERKEALKEFREETRKRAGMEDED